MPAGDPRGTVGSLAEHDHLRGLQQAIGGEFIVKSVAESIGKSGSLKKNYGGYSLRKVRRRIEPLSE